MSNSVLDKRLQNERRHCVTKHSCIGMNLDRQPLTESSSLNPDVEIENLQLTRKRNLVRLHLIQGDSQQLTQPKKNIFGGLRILLNERNRGLQRIEQKVRLNLDAQSLEVSGSHRGFNMRLVNLTPSRFIAKLNQSCGKNDRDVSNYTHHPANFQPLARQGRR